MLSHLFENVRSLILDCADESSHSICALKSLEGEILRLKFPVQWEDKIEIALLKVEKEMKVALNGLFELVQPSMSDFFENSSIDRMVAELPCQICILGFECWWSFTCVDTLMQSPNGLSPVKENLSAVVMQTVALMHSTISKLDRTKLE